MKFSDMISFVSDEVLEKSPYTDFEINKLCYNSSEIEKNDIFFAVTGLRSDGNLFINDAVQNGAAAIISEKYEKRNDIPVFKVQDCRKAMAIMAVNFYDEPSAKLKLIGVTGTNGKTTVTSIIEHVLSYNGKRTGLIGTNGNYINKIKYDADFTTPESVELNEFLNKMVSEKVEYAVMEVSSHSISLKRIYGLIFDIVVFTNLTPEHLDFHQNMGNYFKEKKILFDGTGKVNLKGNITYAVFNSENHYGERITRDTRSEKISYGFKDSDYMVDDLIMNFDGMTFNIYQVNQKNKLKINTCLTGKFNVYNILAAVAVLRCLNLSFEEITKGIKDFRQVEGRFNIIRLKNNSVAIIDYSHTPDSLLKAITTIEEIMNSSGLSGKIITLFGCGGDRDKTKRPVMGEIASAHSDHVIITSDNPRTEEPLSIINEIVEGIKNKNYTIIEDRKDAIKKAFEISEAGDIILIAGKGHESYQEINGVKHHFNDKEIITEIGV